VILLLAAGCGAPAPTAPASSSPASSSPASSSPASSSPASSSPASSSRGIAQTAEAYAQALALVAREPQAGAAACAALSEAALRVDCLGVAAEALAPRDPDAAAAQCASLPEGSARDECHFQVAERSHDAARCDQAGAFADDCRLHRLSTDLLRLLPRGTTPGAFEAELAAALPGYGLAPDDPRPWSAAYRWVLGSQRPLDRGSCQAAPDAARREACLHTAVALFQDRLNHARDTGTFPCEGGPLPPELAYLPDLELDAALAARRGEDLCR